MARNPRSKGASRTDTDNKENTDVSDTATDPEAVEVPTTEAAAEAPAPEAPAPKADKPVIDHEGNLFGAIVTFATSEDEGKVATLQEAYRAVPAAARGKVQGVAMKKAMTEGNVDMDVLGDVLDAFNNLPTATKSTRTKVELPPEVAGAIKLGSLMVAYEVAKQELGPDADAQAKVWWSDGTPDEHRDNVLRLATNAVKALDKGGKGGSGERVQLTETLKDMLDRGAISAGAELKGAGDAVATLNEDGTISTLNKSFDNPSAAARAHRVDAATGKATSTNGWEFWSIDGKSIGSLRVK